MNLGDVFLRAIIKVDPAEIKRAAGEAGKELDKSGLEQKGRSIGDVFKDKVSLGFAAAGAAAGAFAAVGLKMGDEYKEAMNSIRTGTGATGEALAGLEQSFKNAAGRVKEDIGVTAAVMADLNTRTGLTGTALEDLTVRVIEFSRVTGSDATANTAALTRLFGDWNIATEDQTETMDQLMRASQASGIEMDRLMQTVVQFGAPMRLLGFSFEESIALLGKWEKEGVNTETMLQGLKFSVKTLAQEGVPASEMAATLQEKIAAIGKSADPVAESIKLFGLRAGPDLAAAILEGRFSIDDLMEAIENGSDTVNQAAKDTRDFGDGFAELKNKVKLAIGPIMQGFAGLASELGNAIYLLPALGGALGKVTAALHKKVAAMALARTGMTLTQLATHAMLGPLGLITAALAIAMGAWLSWQGAVERGTERGKELVLELAQMNGGIRTQADVVKVSAQAQARALDELHRAYDANRNDLIKIAPVIGPVISAWNDLTAEQEYNAKAAAIQEEAQRQLAETLKRALSEGLDAYLANLDQMVEAMRGLGPDFELTGAAVKQLADRFGVSAQEVREHWRYVQEDLAERNERIRGYLAQQADDFEMTAEAAQQTATLLGVSVADIERVWGEMGRAVAEATEETVTAIHNLGDRSVEALERMRERALEVLRGLVGVAFDLGTAVPSEIGRGMVELSREIVTAADHLKWVLENGLTDKERRSYVVAKKWMKLWREGIESEVPGARDATFRLGIESLEALSTGTLKGEESKRVARIAGDLFAQGWTEREVLVALATQGVGEAALIALGKVAGWSETAVRQAILYEQSMRGERPRAEAGGLQLGHAALTGVNRIDWAAWGLNAGSAWARALARAIGSTDSARSLQTQLARFAGPLRAFSPPREGPLRGIDKWGASIGRSFVDPLVGQLEEAPGRARPALARLIDTLRVNPLQLGEMAIGEMSALSPSIRNELIRTSSSSSTTMSSTTSSVRHDVTHHLDAETIALLRKAGFDEEQLAKWLNKPAAGFVRQVEHAFAARSTA